MRRAVCAVQCRAAQCRAVPYRAVPRRAVPYRTAPFQVIEQGRDPVPLELLHEDGWWEVVLRERRHETDGTQMVQVRSVGEAAVETG